MSKPFASTFLFILFTSGLAHADGLNVASDPNAPPAPAPAPAVRDTTTPDKEPEARKGVGFGASLYMLSGAAIDDFKEGGFMLRPELELYAAFGAGDVNVLLGGTVLGAEIIEFGPRTNLSYPALLTVAVRSDKWMAGLSGGISVAVDNSYDDVEDEESSMPSPRGEIRGGYRWENMLELQGVVGAERELYSNRDDTTRLYFGLSVGIGADSNQKK